MAPEQHVAVDPAIAQMQPQNGSVHDGIEFDPTFDWVSDKRPTALYTSLVSHEY